MPPHYNRFLNPGSLNQDAVAPSGSGSGEGQLASSALEEEGTPVGEVVEDESRLFRSDSEEEE
jgi:hypothetical protein